MLIHSNACSAARPDFRRRHAVTAAETLYRGQPPSRFSALRADRSMYASIALYSLDASPRVLYRDHVNSTVEPTLELLPAGSELSLVNSLLLWTSRLADFAVHIKNHIQNTGRDRETNHQNIA
jgi:hypothetical protein